MSAVHILRKLALTPCENDSWSMVVDRNLCLGRPGAKHMSGGACSAAFITAAEQQVQKPIIQASIQFLRTPAAEEEIELQLNSHQPGRSIDIATASIISNGTICAHMMGSFGQRALDAEYIWAKVPEVPNPKACKKLPFIRADEGDLHTYLDVMIAGAPKNGGLAFWVRAPDPRSPIDSRFLSIIADYIPEAIHFNIG